MFKSLRHKQIQVDVVETPGSGRVRTVVGTRQQNTLNIPVCYVIRPDLRHGIVQWNGHSTWNSKSGTLKALTKNSTDVTTIWWHTIGKKCS